MRAFLSLFALFVSANPSFAQPAAPGSKVIDLHVPSITQPMLPIWYNIMYVSIAVVAIFFVYVLYRTLKDKTYTH